MKKDRIEGVDYLYKTHFNEFISNYKISLEDYTVSEHIIERENKYIHITLLCPKNPQTLTIEDILYNDFNIKVNRLNTYIYTFLQNEGTVRYKIEVIASKKETLKSDIIFLGY